MPYAINGQTKQIKQTTQTAPDPLPGQGAYLRTEYPSQFLTSAATLPSEMRIVLAAWAATASS